MKIDVKDTGKKIIATIEIDYPNQWHEGHNIQPSIFPYTRVIEWYCLDCLKHLGETRF